LRTIIVRDAKKVGDTLLSIRTEACWTQKEMAHALGVNQGTVSRWERGEGRPPLLVVRETANGCQIDVFDAQNSVFTTLDLVMPEGTPAL